MWVVITLLAFGSLLFCLCCYKVSNLLYMLYHIDDSTESLTGAGGGPGGADAAAIAALTNGTTVTSAGAVSNSGGGHRPVPISLALEAGGRTGSAASAAAAHGKLKHRKKCILVGQCTVCLKG